MTNTLDEILLATLRAMSEDIEAFGYIDSKDYLPEKRQAILQWVADEVKKSEPGTWTDIEGTDDPEWRGYVKGVQDYKNNLLAILKQHGWKEREEM